jgi:hypothetical protein
MSKVKVIAAVVDTRQLTLYDTEGNTVVIPQGDPRVRRIVDEVMPVLKVGGIAEVLVDEGSQVYDEFEEKSGGLVKFFRVAKSKLKGLFGGEDAPVAPTGEFGDVLTAQLTSDGKPTMAEAVDEILSHAKPVGKAPETNDNTIIAVVGEGNDRKIVPDVQQLKSHLKHSNLHGSTIGMENLLKRLAAIIDKRQHSVEDVLKFMERADLPVADDGTIIAYKVLRSVNREGDRIEGTFFDPYTRKVPQRVGSRVVVDESLVDRDRSRDCSNGLHIARRGYLGSFTADVCFICKVAPEDVITVPHRDANKVRVSAYHIIFELENSDYLKVRSGRPFTDGSQGKELLARAISGDHIRVIEEVRITKQLGEGIVITPLLEGAASQAAIAANSIAVPAHAVAVEPVADKDDRSAPPVSPKEISRQISDTKKDQPVKSTGNPRQIKAQELAAKITDTTISPEYRKAFARGLLDHKKTSKVSWDKLGVSQVVVNLANSILANEPAPVKASKKTKALSAALHPTKTQPETAPAKAEAQPKPQTKVAETAAPKAEEPKNLSGLTVKEVQLCKQIKAGTITKTAAAHALGVHRRTVDRLLAKFG